jgi:hypothetical protein
LCRNTLSDFTRVGSLRTTARFHVDVGTLALEDEEVWPWVEE